MRFKQRAKECEGYIIGLRRDFHANPELSFKEVRTAQVVCDELERLGIRYVRLEHGVVGHIIGKEGGRSIALRADMDALPIEEENVVSYASNNAGVMHACGHDGHTAMLLGAAKLLAEARDQLKGEVYLCFQAAEEVGGGALEIIEYLDSQGGVDEAIACHLWADIPAGDISVVKGPRMAGGSGFTIEVFGRGGHGSRPDLAIDPLKPAASILLALSAIPSNRYKAIEPMVVHVGQFTGGTMGNIFPQKAVMAGGIRVFSEEGERVAKELVSEIVENCAKMYGAKGKVSFRRGIPIVNNDAVAVKRAEATLGKLNCFNMVDFEQICASENFGEFVKKYTGLMAFIGVRNEEKGICFGQHHPKFDIDEDVLWRGTAFLAQYTVDFLDEA